LVFPLGAVPSTLSSCCRFPAGMPVPSAII
jgi:hypothetical protein